MKIELPVCICARLSGLASRLSISFGVRRREVMRPRRFASRLDAGSARSPPLMLLTLTTTHRPATDLGFLLRKNPARAQTFELPFGEVRVFYPEANDERCTCALQVVVDPIGLVRRRGGPAGDRGALEQYVNDRPYVASSFLSVAMARVFDSALAGRAKERP